MKEVGKEENNSSEKNLKLHMEENIILVCHLAHSKQYLNMNTEY